MTFIDVALPGTILSVKVLLKLFVDRSVTSADCVGAILALPVDVVFLAVSLITGVAIASPDQTKAGFLIFGLCVAVAILTVVLWRRSDSLFVRNRYGWCAANAILNLVISFGALLAAIQHLIGVAK